MATVVDEAKRTEFLDRAVNDIGAGISAPLVLVGDRLGRNRRWAGPGRSRHSRWPRAPACRGATRTSGCALRPRASSRRGHDPSARASHGDREATSLPAAEEPAVLRAARRAIGRGGAPRRQLVRHPISGFDARRSRHTQASQ